MNPWNTPDASLRPAAPGLPEDVQTPWGWVDVAWFLLVAFLSLVVVTAVAWIAARLWVHPKNLAQFLTTDAASLALRQVGWYLLLLLYLAISLRLRWNIPFWRSIGWRRLPERFFRGPLRHLTLVLSGMLLAVVVELASLPFHPKTKLPIEALFRDRRSLLWLAALGVLIAPVVEETIFRGFLYPVLARSFGVTGGVFATGLLFGLLHVLQLWGGWAQVGLITLVGIVLTYVRARTGTVLASYLLHLGYNTFLFAGFYVSTGGFRHLPGGFLS